MFLSDYFIITVKWFEIHDFIKWCWVPHPLQRLPGRHEKSSVWFLKHIFGDFEGSSKLAEFFYKKCKQY